VEESTVDWNWELLDGPDTITEGPAWDGEGLFFTSCEKSEIRRYDPATGSNSVVYSDTEEANGLMLAPDGRLYACAGEGGAVVAYDTDGRRSVLANEFEGKRLNSPNDLLIDTRGRIWFTDPRYSPNYPERQLDHDSVYRITPPANGEGQWPIERLTFDTTRPNGLLLSFDEQTLFVVQSDHTPERVRQLRAYPVLEDGTLDDHRVLHDFGPDRGIDGMCFDTDGNIVATCGWELGGPGGRITVFAQDGTILQEHSAPTARPTNCTFGGPDLDVLFVTAIAGELFRIDNTGLRGQLPPPRVRPFTGR
jgi:gluconolactonase